MFLILLFNQFFRSYISIRISIDNNNNNNNNIRISADCHNNNNNNSSSTLIKEPSLLDPHFDNVIDFWISTSFQVWQGRGEGEGERDRGTHKSMRQAIKWERERGRVREEMGVTLIMHLICQLSSVVQFRKMYWSSEWWIFSKPKAESFFDPGILRDINSSKIWVYAT